MKARDVFTWIKMHPDVSIPVLMFVLGVIIGKVL